MKPVLILAIVTLVVTGTLRPAGFAAPPRDAPTAPSPPEHPVRPGHPGTPGTPATPATPAAPETPGTPATPATPATPSLDSADFDAERAARELLIAQERLLAEGDHARLSGDSQMLYALAIRYLSLARQHYRAGRSYQAAEVATAVTRLADAIRHLSWAAGAN
ncbi:MAG: hypothetical protein E6H05_08260 [Bacillati bacterium ANGP1]|uniref:DUF4398 domain-containing protein n=1 Tax=Candidatus Segetimicrobium genomatis TaxID=2569760 RepID=A0A537IRL5_9BACT|nr:MAG: hypothetical protein E6H05_08260 [Terrabacteria group bacterium ANGP1]